jgi:hypothetical protein
MERAQPLLAIVHASSQYSLLRWQIANQTEWKLIHHVPLATNLTLQRSVAAAASSGVLGLTTLASMLQRIAQRNT